MAFTAIGIILGVMVVCESAFIDTLTKCSIKDGECLRELYQRVLQDISKNGIKELSIPPIDPIELKNVTVNMLDLLEATMVDGIATGVKNCVFNDFKTELDKEHAWMDLTCDITVKGHYKLFSDSPLIKSLIGKQTIHGDGFVKIKLGITELDKEHAWMDLTCDITVKGHYKLFSDSPLIKSLIGKQTIHGDGFVKIKLERLNLRIDYDFYIVRGKDGELYFKCKHNETQYKYNIAGRSLFYIDHLFLGSEDLSKYVTSFLNENGKLLLQNFGRSFMDKAMEFFYIFTHRFYDVVPLKYYITEDLSNHVKEN